MERAAQPAMNEALDRLWKQFLPQLEERVGTLEAAAQALATGGLSIDQQALANSAAHKLAGVLGTFGLTKATIIAREAEILFSGDTDPAAAPHLAEIAAQLRAMLAQRK